MFGSDDDKKTPGDAGEKKSLFGWMRKKPQGETPAAQAPATPGAEPLPVAPAPEAAGQAAPQSLPATAVTVEAAVETTTVPVAPTVAALASDAPAPVTPAVVEPAAKPGFFARFKAAPAIAETPVAATPAPISVAPAESAPLPVIPDVAVVDVAVVTPAAAEPVVETPAVLPELPVALAVEAPVAAPEPVAVPATVETAVVEAAAVSPAPVEAPVSDLSLVVGPNPDAPAESPTKPGFFARLLPGAAPVASESAPAVAAVVVPAAEPAAAVVSAEEQKASFFARLKQGLSKTSASLGEGMASLFLGKKAIDDDLLDEIETRLLTADVGVEATTAIVQSLTKRVARKELADSGALYKALQEELAALLRPVEKPLQISAANKPFVILVVGVNGAGKTTTIGKLAKKLQLEGKKVMLAAGDTFRAAAVEQLQVWGERNQIAVIAQHTGADSASVIFDAVQAATARGMDVLIADTAGRLHTKDNLMEELKKVRRVIGKLDDTAPHEVLLVLDAGTGQNAINQAKQFNQTVNLTGLALTKLDGTAKGGVIFALAKQFALPIRYIGVGEGIDDLRTFEAEPFVRALFDGQERA
ncbi:MAG TPA: signal recognition particle-docking protein FtsY [Pseudomonas sp.]|uniref:signal recognition particle-docking protein FtsY n=1 Tax=Pseudomonas sp. TaxID=306 RepID=UPI002C774A15|nr:signal recognition particle-docking protein FtsY [Pseudomonas sp.]HRL93126.1 signal recognition particle-docking protein FtsY [Pseudomonas sp.]